MHKIMHWQYNCMMCNKINLLLQDGWCDLILGMVCCCCWLLVQWWLLLLVCPPPPEMVPRCFPFSSWSGTTPRGHQLQLPGFNPLMILLDGVVVMCLRTMVFSCLPGSGQMAGASSSHALLSSCWFSWLLWCCQQHTQSDNWAACKQLGCLSLRLDLILPMSMWNGCVGNLVHMCCVTHNFKEQIPHLIIYTQWCKWQNTLPSLRVNPTNTNPFLLFYFFCLIVCFAGYKVKVEDYEGIRRLV
jgi:hypothetical protein